MKRLDRNILFALSAANEALGDAGINGYRPERVGVVLGSGIGGLHELLRQYDVLLERGPARVSPSFLPNVLAGLGERPGRDRARPARPELRRRLGVCNRFPCDREGADSSVTVARMR